MVNLSLASRLRIIQAPVSSGEVEHRSVREHITCFPDVIGHAEGIFSVVDKSLIRNKVLFCFDLALEQNFALSLGCFSRGRLVFKIPLN